MKTLVLGASLNKDRFSNKAILRLIESGHEVYAIGNRKGEISNVSISTDLLKIKNIHTVTIYLSKKNQVLYYKYIVSLKPKRVLFNPGAENFEFSNILIKKRIHFENACTLILLSTNQYET
ncbi:MAG: CoA-binding protein [Flavobacteriaceae bacterium]|nr:CoA-binding protein [Flavobacteriaceae bacterium]|tara:strand:+ start:229 stop:591 length:363 start_codon:yes stop_codon:yes gene_type:complete